LRVINEDRVIPGAGFPTHPHSDMEIISYVLDGAVAHKDTMGTAATIRPGEVQRMSAGTGIRHSEYNDSKSEPAHFLQIWIEPEKDGITPSYEQRAFSDAEKSGKWRLVGSRDGRDGSVTIHQDVDLYATLLSDGDALDFTLGANRNGWLQVARGRVRVNGETLKEGDGASFTPGTRIDLVADADAEMLLFDLA
jgi:hypothetical protein